MNSPFKFSFFLIASMLLFAACKKSKNDPAVITIVKPLSGTVYFPGDTIQLEADIRDDDKLGSATIKLLNAAYTPVSHQDQVPLNELTEYHLNQTYVIDNFYLESGTYFITVSVSDGNEDANEYRAIVIHELPETRKAVYIITRPDSMNVNVVELDSVGQQQNRLTVPGDYAESAINSRYQQLIISGQFGYYNQYDLETYANVFSEPPYNGAGPSYLDLFFYDNLTYVSYYDGRIQAFDRYGAVKFNSEQPVYYQPGTLCVNSEYVFAEAFYSVQGVRKFEVINNPTGVTRQEYNLGADIAAIHSTGENEVTIFGNKNGDGKIYAYHVLNNYTDDLHTLPGITVYSAVAIDADNYALATQYGLYSYQQSINNLIPLDVSEPVYSLEYDHVNGILFANAGRKIKSYIFPNAAVIATVISVDSVLDIRVLYNK